MDNRQHSERVYNLLNDNISAKYEVLSGTYYNIYEKGRMKATRMTIDCFDNTLGRAVEIPIALG